MLWQRVACDNLFGFPFIPALPPWVREHGIFVSGAVLYFGNGTFDSPDLRKIVLKTVGDRLLPVAVAGKNQLAAALPDIFPDLL